ncbi:MAG: membrane protein insertase YidC [Pseudomonadaceae bacterium]
MNLQRNILIGALLVITYLMVVQWNKDFVQQDLAPAAQTEGTSQGFNDLSASANTPANEEPMVPSQTSTSAEMPTATSRQQIQVDTDTLKLSISLVGGDIVSLALPQYPTRKDRPDLPFQLLEQSSNRTYIARSGLTSEHGPDTSTSRARYEVEQNSFRLADGEEKLIVDLKSSNDDIGFIKRFTFTRGSYLIEVSYVVDNQSDHLWEGVLMGDLKRDGSDDPSSTTATGMATFLGAAYRSTGGSYTKLKLAELDDKQLNESVTGGWIAWLQHYFLSAWVPNPEADNKYTTKKVDNGNYFVGFESPPLQVNPGQQNTFSASLYAGPKIQADLAAISPQLEKAVDYGILWWIAEPLFWVLSLIHGFVGNWGWSIILLTCLIKLIFFPLSATSYRSMANMRRVAPKLQALREQYGDDRQKMSQGMMELYKKEKINPLGGCLPILVQMPVFIALYWVLMESVEIRQAEWLGWITDLSLKDPYFILPIIMGATMFLQQQLNPTPPDPMQAKVMKLLPIVFTFFFLWFPAGLVLYWVVNNCLSIAQQWYITRQIEKGAASKD